MPPVGTVGALMATILRVYSAAGSVLGVIPEHVGLQIQQEFNNAGSIRFDVARDAPGAALLDADDPRIAVVIDGVEQPVRFLIDDDEDDAARSTGKVLTVAGRGYLALLERARVYPRDYVTGQPVLNLEPFHAFGSSSPGAILGTLLQRAQTRGGLTGLTWTFTSSVDSNGAAWPENFTVTYDAGLDYLAIITAMADNAWIDVRMTGTEVQAYVPDTLLGADRPQAVLRTGQGVVSGGRKRTRRGIASEMLGVGDEGALAVSSDATSRARYGRREGYEARGGVTDVGTLQALTDAALEKVTATGEGFTVGLTGLDGPQPGTDFDLGNRIRWDQRPLPSGIGLEPLRVRSIAYTWAGVESAPQVSVELADLFVERTVRLARKVDGIVGGSGSNSRAPRPPTGADSVVPNAPASVSVSSAAYRATVDGPWLAAATITWPAVTTNVDATAYDDFGAYLVSVKVGTEPYSPDTQVQGDATLAYVSGLPAGANLTARVRTVDASGNASGYTYSQQVVLSTDTTPPPVPSTPVVTPYLGHLRIAWDGLGSAGEAMPSDWDRTEVHLSSGSGFTPSAATYLGTIRSSQGGPFYATNLPYGTPHFARLIAFDRLGNASAASAQGSATPARITGLDLAAGSVGYDAIQFKDTGNLIPDGSFETQPYRDTLALPTGFAFDTNPLSGKHGTYTLAVNANATDRSLALVTDAQARAGDKFLVRFNARPSSATGTVAVRIQAADAAGAHLAFLPVSAAATPSGVFTTYSGTVTLPTGTTTIRVQVHAPATFTAGTYSLDTVEVRQVVGTSLIDDAAITTAKIQDGAITNLKVTNLDAAKITTGTLDADRIGTGAINVAKLAYGPGQNLSSNPIGANADLRVAQVAQGTSGAFSYDSTGTFAGGQRIVGNGATAAGSFRAIPHLIGAIPVQPGDRFFYSAQIKRDGGNGTVLLDASGRNAAGTVINYPGMASVNTTTAAASGTWKKFSGILTVPADTYSLQPRFQMNNDVTAGFWSVDDVEFRPIIATRATSGARVEVSPLGFFAYDEDDASTVSLAQGLPDFLSLSKGGVVQASISEDGEVSGKAITASDNLYYRGEELTAFLDRRARGLVQWGARYTATTASASNSLALEIGYLAEGGRMYKVHTSPLRALSTVSNDYVEVKITRTSDGSAPTASSPIFARFQAAAANSGVGVPINKLYSPGSTLTQRLLISISRISGTGNVSLLGSTDDPIEVWVEDVGPYVEQGGVIRDGAGVAAQPMQQYTKRFYATSSRSYDGGGAYMAYRGDLIVQGDYGGNGNQRSMVGFDHATIASTLAGSTLRSAKFYAYANHWYNNGGGTAVLGYHNATSLGATFSGTTNQVQSAGWPKPGARVVDLGVTFGNRFRDGTAKGMTFGPGPTSSTLYYGKFDGAAGNKPYLEFTYVK